MARPNLTNLNYFPFDVDFFDDDKVQLIEAEFGHKGVIIAIRLLCKIYKENGYYYQWGDDQCLLFSRKAGDGIVPRLINEVISGLVKRGFFDETVFNTFKVLTSKGIQERYIRALERCKSIKIYKEFLCKNTDFGVNVTLISINDELTNVNDELTPQIKENKSKSKEKESKVNILLEKESKECEQNSFLNSENESSEKSLKTENVKRKKVPPKKEKVLEPDLREFLEYGYNLVLENNLGSTEAWKMTLEGKYESWKDNGWKDGNGNSIKNWKTKLKNTMPYLKPINFENGKSITNNGGNGSNTGSQKASSTPEEIVQGVTRNIERRGPLGKFQGFGLK